MDRESYRKLEEAWERISEVLAAEDRSRERRATTLHLVEVSEAASSGDPTQPESVDSTQGFAGIREE